MSNATHLKFLIKDRTGGWEFTDSHSAPYHFSLEEINLESWNETIRSNWKFTIYVGILYVLAIFGIQRWMKDRLPYQLKMPLFWWNLALGVFSIAGFCRMLPGFLHALGSENGFYQTICVTQYLDIPTTFWKVLFTFSKFIELGDTLFIVLRKKPLMFLQWYHHLATMYVVWITFPDMEPVTMRWYTIMNFGVHSLMYPYFAMRALGKHAPPLVANLITTLQFTQMIVGLSINVLSTYYKQSMYGCARTQTSIELFMVLYGSFVLLFGNLFYNSVIKKGRMSSRQISKKME